MKKTCTQIGLISDTHGLLREEAVRTLQGCELIIHAGDVGKPEILETLKHIAPVVAVRGNIDTATWAALLPATQIVETSRATLYLLHNLQELDLDPAAVGFHIVISGHTHKPARSQRSGVLYLNPGSAGPRRFDLPVTLARLDLARSPFQIKFIDLSTDQLRKRK